MRSVAICRSCSFSRLMGPPRTRSASPRRSPARQPISRRPTALRMLRSAPSPKGRHDIRLRTLGSGGESLGAETYEWGREAFGLTINEFYGQTECNLVLSSCQMIGVSKPGAIGKPVPGHDVAVIRPDGTRADAGELGQIAVRRGDPVMFLEYWGRAEATQQKFIGDWMTTGDQGTVEE